MPSQSKSPTPLSHAGGAPRYRRIVVKAGTTLLTGGGDRLNLQVMATLVEQISQLHLAGVETLLDDRPRRFSPARTSPSDWVT